MQQDCRDGCPSPGSPMGEHPSPLMVERDFSFQSMPLFSHELRIISCDSSVRKPNTFYHFSEDIQKKSQARGVLFTIAARLINPGDKGIYREKKKKKKKKKDFQ